MEDVFAFFLVSVVIAFFVAGAIALHKFLKKKKKEEEEMMAARKKQIEEYWDKKKEQRAAHVAQVNSTPIKKVEVPPRGKETTVSYTTPAPAPSYSSQSSPSDDGFMNGLIIGAVVDNLLHSSSHSEERSVGVSKTESSWGFDDSDSRKSISDTFSSSWSSSDSSSDSWSSSDSGPSSDW